MTDISAYVFHYLYSALCITRVSISKWVKEVTSERSVANASNLAESEARFNQLICCKNLHNQGLLERNLRYFCAFLCHSQQNCLL